MTNRFKDFGAGSSVNKEPIVFKLHGEEFTCVPSLQGKALLGIVSGASAEDGAAAAKSIIDFFEVCLVAESYERFDNLLSDPEKIVSVDTLGDITAWLVEQYSSRPTKGPEPSQSGQ